MGSGNRYGVVCDGCGFEQILTHASAAEARATLEAWGWHWIKPCHWCSECHEVLWWLATPGVRP